MIIKENEIIYKSNNQNVCVAYKVYDLGNKYKVCRKTIYKPENYETWEYLIAFATWGEAINYAKRIFDEVIIK